MPPKSSIIIGALKSKGWNKTIKTLLENKEKVGRKLVIIPGAEGTRIWPSKFAKDDAKSQFRIGRGATIKNLPSHMKVYLQVNKEAKDESLKAFIKASRRGTHAILAEATIDTRKADGEKVIDMVNQFNAAMWK